MITSDTTVSCRPAVLSAVVLAAIVLTGCGSSSSPSTTTTTTSAPINAPSESATTSETSTTTAPPASNKAADQRVAREAGLRLTDFPTGWTESDKETGASQSPCQVVNSAKAETTARDTSHTFTKGNNTPQAESVVYVYADTGAATRWFDEISGSATRSCLGSAAGKQVANNAKKEGASVGEITTGSLSIEPIGDARAAGRISIPIKIRGLNVTATVDLVFVRVGRGIAILTFLDTLSPFDQTLAATLTRDVVDRLGAELKKQPATS